MNTENLRGKKVRHKAFGDGIIEEFEDDVVKVRFDRSKEVKKFSYSLAFKKFFTIIDGSDIVPNNTSINDITKEGVEPELNKNKPLSWASFGTKVSTKHLYIFGSVADFCDKFKAGLISEITYLREQGEKRQKLFDGK